MNTEIYKNKQILQVTPFIGPTLFSLFQKGIKEQDIIGINQQVESCTNNNTVSGNSSPKIMMKIKSTKIMGNTLQQTTDPNTGIY